MITNLLQLLRRINISARISGIDHDHIWQQYFHLQVLQELQDQPPNPVPEADHNGELPDWRRLPKFHRQGNLASEVECLQQDLREI